MSFTEGHPAAAARAVRPGPRDVGRTTLGASAYLVAFACLFPLLAALTASLEVKSGYGYGWWWGTGRGWSILGRTLGFSVAASGVGTFVGWVVACAAGRLRRGAGWTLIVLSLLPVVLPSSLWGTAWIMALGRDGVVTEGLRGVLGDWPWTVYRFPVAAGVVGLRYAGVAALLLYPHRRCRGSLDAAARVFNVPRITAVLHIVVRGSLKPLAAACLLLTLLAMNDHVTPGLFLITTYGTQVMIQHNALLDPAGAAALALPIAGIGVLMGCAALRLGTDAFSTLERYPLWSSGRPWASTASASALVIVAVAVPGVALLTRAGPPWEFAGSEAWRTAGLAAVTGPMCALLGVPLAWHWRNSARSLTPLVLVNLIVPPSLLAIGVMGAFERPPLGLLRDGDWPLVMGYVVRFLPIAVLALLAAWSGQPRAGIDAARAHGVLPRDRFLWVALPMHGPAVVGAAGLCALLVATELEVSLLLTPPGVTTLGVRLYSMIHTAPDAAVSGLALAAWGYVLGVLLVFAAIAAVWRRAWRS